MRAILIHNPDAGDGRHKAEALTNILEGQGFTVSYCSTKDERFREVMRGEADLVVGAGGDGTIAKVVRDLKGRVIPMAIFPLGTANNIALAFGITGELEAVAAGWRSAAPQKFDVGSVVGPWGQSLFLEAVGIGAFADAVERLDRKNLDGSSAEKLEAARRGYASTLEKAEPISATIVADGETLPGNLLLVEIMSITHMGPRLRLADRAECGDGYLDVVYLPEKRRDEMRDWLLSGDADAPAPVSTIRVRKVSVDWNGGALRVGDKMVPQDAGCGRVEIGLEPHGVAILAPPRPSKAPSADAAAVEMT